MPISSKEFKTENDTERISQKLKSTAITSSSYHSNCLSKQTIIIMIVCRNTLMHKTRAAIKTARRQTTASSSTLPPPLSLMIQNPPPQEASQLSSALGWGWGEGLTAFHAGESNRS